MKTARKVLIIALCAVLLVSASVMGTLAYLTAKTDAVTNTFTVGKVSFDADSALDEALVNLYGEPIEKDLEDDTQENVVAVEDAPRVTENKYKLIPGKTYTKDPTVHMGADTEECWLFVKVDNAISDIEDQAKTIHSQMIKDGTWTPVAEGSNIYYYKTSVKANEDIVVFSSFTLAQNLTDTELNQNANDSIVIQALAIQKEGLDSAAAAWTANGSEWPAN